jgi:hypothetical protein
VSPESYCRDLEAYLCRKNDGHLIRIAGPAFERVSRWAEDGIPLKVACAGIDRYFERYYRKGPRRRPVRIEFCEADVLDAFDDWRRAVGVAQDPGQQQASSARARTSLASHIERTVARLTTLRASAQATQPIDATLARVARELDQMQGTAKAARGAAREAVLSQLDALDRELMAAAMNAIDTRVQSDARAEAAAELTPFRERMTPDAYDRACTAAIERYVREHFGLPTVSFT